MSVSFTDEVLKREGETPETLKRLGEQILAEFYRQFKDDGLTIKVEITQSTDSTQAANVPPWENSNDYFEQQ